MCICFMFEADGDYLSYYGSIIKITLASLAKFLNGTENRHTKKQILPTPLANSAKDKTRTEQVELIGRTGEIKAQVR